MNLLFFHPPLLHLGFSPPSFSNICSTMRSLGASHCLFPPPKKYFSVPLFFFSSPFPSSFFPPSLPGPRRRARAIYNIVTTIRMWPTSWVHCFRKEAHSCSFLDFLFLSPLLFERVNGLIIKASESRLWLPGLMVARL